MSGDIDVPRPQERPRTWIVILLLIAAVLVAFPLLHGNTSTVTQTETQGQCQFTARSFYTKQEAFMLAQAAEQYRSTHPFGGNYSLGSYTICYKNNTQQRFPSPPAPGYDNKTDTTQPENATHGEQAVYKWLQNQLSQLSVDATAVQGVYAVVFSQVQVCKACRSDMIDWQRVLRQKARLTSVFLFIWDLNPGFNPATLPAGPENPVAFTDLERVPIAFAP